MASGVTIHHATMSWDIDGEGLMTVTRLFREDLGTRGAKSAQKNVVGISHYCDASREDVIDAMIASLEDECEVRRGMYRPSELVEAQKMMKAKFGSRAWLHRID